MKSGEPFHFDMGIAGTLFMFSNNMFLPTTTLTNSQHHSTKTSLHITTQQHLFTNNIPQQHPSRTLDSQQHPSITLHSQQLSTTSFQLTAPKSNQQLLTPSFQLTTTPNITTPNNSQHYMPQGFLLVDLGRTEDSG